MPGPRFEVGDLSKRQGLNPRCGQQNAQRHPFHLLADADDTCQIVVRGVVARLDTACGIQKKRDGTVPGGDRPGR